MLWLDANILSGHGPTIVYMYSGTNTNTIIHVFRLSNLLKQDETTHRSLLKMLRSMSFLLTQYRCTLRYCLKRMLPPSFLPFTVSTPDTLVYEDKPNSVPKETDTPSCVDQTSSRTPGRVCCNTWHGSIDCTFSSSKLAHPSALRWHDHSRAVCHLASVADLLDDEPSRELCGQLDSETLLAEERQGHLPAAVDDYGADGYGGQGEK